ncbi:hypothetical protein NPIL_220331 [Nephila pilipes]|uniref:Uncharacterized protein n=1 Tax=Nephila pilipes TaxID=299642 RepID=A0A8X6QRR5_NEPPI|nr:hypothetical protein NPIL_220331 [Nephila pilipes]
MSSQGQFLWLHPLPFQYQETLARPASCNHQAVAAEVQRDLGDDYLYNGKIGRDGRPSQIPNAMIYGVSDSSLPRQVVH